MEYGHEQYGHNHCFCHEAISLGDTYLTWCLMDKDGRGFKHDIMAGELVK